MAKWSEATVPRKHPLMEPLYGGKTACEILGVLFQQQPIRDDYDNVRHYWQSQKPGLDFEKQWRRAVHDGFIAGTALPEKNPDLKTDTITAAMNSKKSGATGLELVFRPDPSVWDGRFANNGWLQECARPVTKLTWDNAVLVSPALAQRNQLTTDDVVELEFNGRKLRGPVWVQPGQAENTVALQLGYGRSRVGRVGRGGGFNSYLLRGLNSLWCSAGLKISRLNDRHHLDTTQTHHNLHGPERQIY